MNLYRKISTPLWLFFSFYLILPNYFALELSHSLPLITASRLILAICYAIIISQNHGKVRIRGFDLNIQMYITIFTLVNIVHLYDTGTSALNRLIVVFVEQAAVFVLISNLVDTEKKFEKAIDLLMDASSVTALISIVGFLFNTNFFYLLKTVSREMTQAGTSDIGYRNGLLRIEAGFGHPVYYAMYCSMMIFVALQLINCKRKKKRASICLILNIVALLLTNSRGSILAVATTLLISFFASGWRERKKYLKLIGVSIVLLGVLFLFSENIRRYVIGIFQSIYIYFGIAKNVSASYQSNYGANMSFTNDRLMQFSGMIWTLKKSPLIGFGYNSHTRGLIKYFYNGIWYPAVSYDVGYVEIVCCYGIIGAISFLFLWNSVLVKLRHIRKFQYGIMFRNIFVVYLLCMLSVVNIDKIFWVFFGLLGAYSNIVMEKSYGNNSEKN